MLEDIKTSNNGNSNPGSVCFKCSTVLDEDSEFCDECGALQSAGNVAATAENLAGSKICPRCNRVAESDEMFCTNCAFDFSKPITPASVPASPACPGCRKNYNVGDKFCRHCAFDLSSLEEKASSTQFCTNCGKSFERDDHFCRHCSFDLTNAKHTVAMPTVKPDSSISVFSSPAIQDIAPPASAPPPFSPHIVSTPPAQTLFATDAAAATNSMKSAESMRQSAPSGFAVWVSPLGAAIAVISFFLPWLSGSVKVFGFNAGGMALSGADFTKFDGSFWLFPLAGIVSLAAFFFCRTQNKVWAARPVIAGSAIFAFVFMFFKLVTIQQQYNQIPNLGLSQYNSGLDIQPQIGIFGLVLGFLASLIGIAFLAKPAAISTNPDGRGLSSSTELSAQQAAIKPNIAGALSYGASFILGILWLPVPIFFLLKSPYKTNHSIRFHSFQAILLIVGLLAISLILNLLFGWMMASPSISTFDQRQGSAVFFMFLLWSIYLGQIVLTVFCAYKAYKNEEYKIPIIGDRAMKWARNGLNF